MNLKYLLSTVLFACVCFNVHALEITLQYPFGANQCTIDQKDGIITLTILAPEEDEFADPYVATFPLGVVLNPDSKTISFDYTATAPFKVTKVWYAPDGGEFYYEPDFEAETYCEASSEWAQGSFSIAAGVEELGFGRNKNDWMRIDFEVEAGTVIKFRNLQVDGTDDPMKPSPDGKVHKGYYLKLEAEDFNPGQFGETWYVNDWTDDQNVDGGPVWSYYLEKGYGKDGYVWTEDDAQNYIASHYLLQASNNHYLFGMGNFWNNHYQGDNAVDGKITFEEARDWWGCWFDYDFEVAEECDAKIDLSAASPHTIWRIQLAVPDMYTPADPDFVQIEGLPENATWVATYTGCAQVMLDGEMLTSNQTKLPTIIHPRELFGDNFWPELGLDDGLAEGQRAWMQRVWDDGYPDPEMWTQDNPDPTIIHILPNAENAESIKDVNQNHHMDTNEASFGFPFYTQHLTPGKHTLRVYSLAQKWYFDYIRIEGIGEPNAIQNVTVPTNDNTVKVYGLNGMLMGNTTEGLKPGVYVVKTGEQTKKIIVK